MHIDALSALIDDLFELSRLEAGDIRWSLEQVPLGELVGETVEAMRVQADAKGVAVVTEVPDALLPARANPEKLQRVLFNLIQNAIRHTPGRRQRRRPRRAGRGPDRDRGRRHRRRDRARSAAARVHGLLSRRRRRRPHRRRRRPRARGLSRDRRGPRRADLARRRDRRAPACASACRWRRRPPRRGGQLRDRGVSRAWTAASAPGRPRRQLHLDRGRRIVADHPVKPPSAQLAAAVRQADDICPVRSSIASTSDATRLVVALLLGEHGHAVGPPARDLGRAAPRR